MTKKYFVQEAVNLLNNSGYSQIEDVKMGQDLVGETTIVRPIHKGKMLVSYFIGERENQKDITHQMILDLNQKLNNTFNKNDLKTLCFTLNVPYENLGAEEKDILIQKLIEYSTRHGCLAEISNYCQQERPHIIWPQFPEISTPTIKQKKDLAIVVRLKHDPLADAANYFEVNQIDSNYVLLVSTPNYIGEKWFPDNGKWEPAVQDFCRTIQRPELNLSQVQRHFFLVAPVQFAFALGWAWGLAREGDKIYHRANGKYAPIITTSREWLQ